MRFVEEVFIADRIFPILPGAGILPYPVPGVALGETYGVNFIHPINREILPNGPTLNAVDPVKIFITEPEPQRYENVINGVLAPQVGWRTSQRILADYVTRIQAFPYQPSRPMILEFIPLMPADVVIDPAALFVFSIWDAKAEFESIHKTRRVYTSGPRGVAGFTLAQTLNDIIQQINSDPYNGMMAYPFDCQVPGRLNLPFNSPLTNSIRFVPAIKRVVPNGGQVLQADYDVLKVFNVAFEVKQLNGELPLPGILPLQANDFYPIAPPDFNVDNHIPIPAPPAIPDYPDDPVWYTQYLGSGNFWQVRKHEERTLGYKGDIYRHYQPQPEHHTNRVYVSDVMVGRYGVAACYDKIILEHKSPPLRESYSIHYDHIQTTIYFAKCVTPYSVIPANYTLYNADGEPSGDVPLFAQTGNLLGYINVNVFGLYNQIEYYDGGNNVIALYPDVPDIVGSVEQLGFAQQLDGQIPGNILSSPPINQLGLNTDVNIIVGGIDFTINDMLQNEVCIPRYGLAAPYETPYAFYNRLLGWAGFQKVNVGTNYNVM